MRERDIRRQGRRQRELREAPLKLLFTFSIHLCISLLTNIYSRYFLFVDMNDLKNNFSIFRGQNEVTRTACVFECRLCKPLCKPDTFTIEFYFTFIFEFYFAFIFEFYFTFIFEFYFTFNFTLLLSLNFLFFYL